VSSVNKIILKNTSILLETDKFW